MGLMKLLKFWWKKEKEIDPKEILNHINIEFSHENDYASMMNEADEPMRVMELLITYKDFVGDVTSRRISQIKILDNDYIEAYCHLRGEIRTFKLDRIIGATIPETGKVISNLWEYFGISHKTKRYESPAQFSSECYDFSVERPRNIHARIKIHYEKSYNTEMWCDLNVSMFYRGDRACKFTGYCLQIQAERTISSKCVKEAYDLETGETIVDLQEFFERKFSETPEFIYDKLFTEHGWEIYTLLYIAAADGAIREPERSILMRFCLEQKSYESLDHDKLENLLRKLQRPTKSEFHKYIREANPEPEVARAVYAVAKEIVATNSKAHSEQTRCLEYIQKQWRSKLV